MQIINRIVYEKRDMFTLFDLDSPKSQYNTPTKENNTLQSFYSDKNVISARADLFP